VQSIQEQEQYGGIVRQSRGIIRIFLTDGEYGKEEEIGVKIVDKEMKIMD
jgi:hypothetical protein